MIWIILVVILVVGGFAYWVSSDIKSLDELQELNIELSKRLDDEMKDKKRTRKMTSKRTKSSSSTTWFPLIMGDGGGGFDGGGCE